MIAKYFVQTVKVSAVMALIVMPVSVLATETTVSSENTPTSVVQTDTRNIPEEVNQQNVTNFGPQTAQPGGQIVNSVTQNNIVAPAPTPTPKPTPIAVRASNDRLTFLITDDLAAVRPGQQLTYRIVVRNDSDEDFNEISITARIPEFVVPFDATPQSQSSNPAQRTITWRDQTISARAEITYTISGTLEAGVPQDFTLQASATINGPGVRASAVDATTVFTIGPAIDEQAAVTVAPVPQVQGVQSIPPAIPVTAKTGAGLAGVGSLISLLAGAIGLRRIVSI